MPGVPENSPFTETPTSTMAVVGRFPEFAPMGLKIPSKTAHSEKAHEEVLEKKKPNSFFDQGHKHRVTTRKTIGKIPQTPAEPHRGRGL